MPRLKLLSDFDGVWTNQGPEAAVLFDYTWRALAAFAEVPEDEARVELETLRQAMRADPARHGWAPDGRISAFVDEDPLVESSALLHALSRAESPALARYREGVFRAGFADLSGFSEHAYREATSVYRQEHPPCLIPDAAQIVAALLGADVELVIVSNSAADKIVAWLVAAGVDAGVEPEHAVRVRGSAAKWRLGPGDETLEVAHRSIHVDRPLYRGAIEEEQPDVLIGDVFSLDLAVPHVMRGAGHHAAPRELVLRRHDHTPAWVTTTRADGAIDHVITELEELVELLAR